MKLINLLFLILFSTSTLAQTTLIEENEIDLEIENIKRKFLYKLNILNPYSDVKFIEDGLYKSPNIDNVELVIKSEPEDAKYDSTLSLYFPKAELYEKLSGWGEIVDLPQEEIVKLSEQILNKLLLNGIYITKIVEGTIRYNGQDHKYSLSEVKLDSHDGAPKFKLLINDTTASFFLENVHRPTITKALVSSFLAENERDKHALNDQSIKIIAEYQKAQKLELKLDAALFHDADFNLKGNNLKLLAYRSDDGYYKFQFRIETESNNMRQFKMASLENKFSEFNTKLWNSITTLIDTTSVNKSDLIEATVAIYIEIFSKTIDVDSHEPKSGTLELAKRNIDVYSSVGLKLRRLNNRKEYKKDTSSIAQRIERITQRKTDTVLYSLIIDSVEFEFFEGNIKNLLVVGRKGTGSNEKVIFANRYPIPFSEFNDYRKFDKTRLSQFKHRNSYIGLDDFLTFKPHLNSRSEDYSPKDTIYYLNTENVSSRLDIYKEKTSRLFSVKIFSDFIGLNDEEPNGLIQTEVSKKIILNSEIKPFLGRGGLNWGFINYVEPKITFSKIDDNNRTLDLKYIENLDDSGQVVSFTGVASSLDLLQHSNISVGAKINAIRFGLQPLKSSFYISFGFDILRTEVKDSTNFKNANIDRPTQIASIPIDNFNTNMFNIYWDFNWEINPDPRYAIGFSTRFHRLVNNSDRLEQVKGSNSVEIESKGKLYSLHINAVYRPNLTRENKNELFFRAGYFTRFSNKDQNFFQTQLGYSFYLLRR